MGIFTITMLEIYIYIYICYVCMYVELSLKLLRQMVQPIANPVHLCPDV